MDFLLGIEFTTAKNSSSFSRFWYGSMKLDDSTLSHIHANALPILRQCLIFPSFFCSILLCISFVFVLFPILYTNLLLCGCELNANVHILLFCLSWCVWRVWLFQKCSYSFRIFVFNFNCSLYLYQNGTYCRVFFEPAGIIINKEAGGNIKCRFPLGGSYYIEIDYYLQPTKQ